MIQHITILLILSLLPQQGQALVVQRGGIQAPTQPQGQSSSDVTRGARFEPQPAASTLRRISTIAWSLVEVRGQEENQVVGIGLVTGLNGTGDSPNTARQIVQNLLFTHNINIDLLQLSPKNVALVRVEATIPPGIKPGRKIDVSVSTIGDAKSLENGTLALTELTDITGNIVFATAAGPINVGGFLAEGDSGSAQQNSVTVGQLPLGGKIEREVPSQIVSEHGYIYLDSRAAHGSFGNTVKIANAVNRMYPGVAEATADGRSIKVRVPEDLSEHEQVAYLDSLLKLEVVPDNLPRVVISVRNGVIVMGEGVRLRPGVVAQGSLTVTIAESPEVSQPAAFSQGTTQEVARSNVQVAEENNGLVLLPGAVTLQEVVEVLNVLGTPPRQLISILEAMSQAGLLLADIQRI